MTRLLPMLTAAALTAVFLVPSSASAFGILRAESDSFTCDPAPVCGETIPCIEGLCVRPPGGNGFCFSAEAEVSCVSSGDLCPAGSSGVPLGGSGLDICVPNTIAGRVCSGRLGACFLDADGSNTVAPFPYGDCDSDGIPNDEEALGEQCNPAPTLGLADEADCKPIEACVDGDCEDGEVCSRVMAAGHRYCLPAGDAPLFCCNEDEATCPGAAACVLPGETMAVACDVTYCAESDALTRARCYTRTDGSRVIHPDEGDCDGDGTDNLTEFNDVAGSECVHADAGMPPVDAGIFDAGSADAGSVDAGPFDASVVDGAPAADTGTDRAVSFGGGGGCVCRAVPGSRSRGALPVALMVGLVAFRRRRGEPRR